MRVAFLSSGVGIDMNPIVPYVEKSLHMGRIQPSNIQTKMKCTYICGRSAPDSTITADLVCWSRGIEPSSMHVG